MKKIVSLFILILILSCSSNSKNGFTRYADLPIPAVASKYLRSMHVGLWQFYDREGKVLREINDKISKMDHLTVLKASEAYFDQNITGEKPSIHRNFNKKKTSWTLVFNNHERSSKRVRNVIINDKNQKVVCDNGVAPFNLDLIKQYNLGQYNNELTNWFFDRK